MINSSAGKQFLLVWSRRWSGPANFQHWYSLYTLYFISYCISILFKLYRNTVLLRQKSRIERTIFSGHRQTKACAQKSKLFQVAPSMAKTRETEQRDDSTKNHSCPRCRVRSTFRQGRRLESSPSNAKGAISKTLEETYQRTSSTHFFVKSKSKTSLKNSSLQKVFQK